MTLHINKNKFYRKSPKKQVKQYISKTGGSDNTPDTNISRRLNYDEDDIDNTVDTNISRRLNYDEDDTDVDLSLNTSRRIDFDEADNTLIQYKDISEFNDYELIKTELTEYYNRDNLFTIFNSSEFIQNKLNLYKEDLNNKGIYGFNPYLINNDYISFINSNSDLPITLGFLNNNDYYQNDKENIIKKCLNEILDNINTEYIEPTNPDFQLDKSTLNNIVFEVQDIFIIYLTEYFRDKQNYNITNDILKEQIQEFIESKLYYEIQKNVNDSTISDNYIMGSYINKYITTKLIESKLLLNDKNSIKWNILNIVNQAQSSFNYAQIFEHLNINQSIFDVIMSDDTKIKEFLEEDRNNFVIKHNNQYFGTTFKLINSSSKYVPCYKNTLTPHILDQSGNLIEAYGNVEQNFLLFSLVKLGLATEATIPYDNLQNVLFSNVFRNAKYKAISIINGHGLINSAISYDALINNEWVSGHHCNTGKFNLSYIIPIVIDENINNSVGGYKYAIKRRSNKRKSAKRNSSKRNSPQKNSIKRKSLKKEFNHYYRK